MLSSICEVTTVFSIGILGYVIIGSISLIAIIYLLNFIGKVFIGIGNIFKK